MKTRREDDLTAALEVLRQRYESGDHVAALEAIALLGPIGRFQDRAPPGWISAPCPHRRGTNDEGSLRLYYPPRPSWLEVARREALWTAIRYGQDSIRRAFGVPVASGSNPSDDYLAGVHTENRALGYKIGFDAARDDTRLRHPRGEDGASLAGLLLLSKSGSGKRVSKSTINRWCRAAMDRGALNTYPRLIDQCARRVYQWVLATEQYPPWDAWDSLSVLEALERKGLLAKISKRRFW